MGLKDAKDKESYMQGYRDGARSALRSARYAIEEQFELYDLDPEEPYTEEQELDDDEYDCWCSGESVETVTIDDSVELDEDEIVADIEDTFEKFLGNKGTNRDGEDSQQNG